ncbi:hypothetical protein Salat_2157500 [Sesamum alatum]|uniref:DUF4283 domain-containing protein n=1 Tax=Sesamum alatum TaxID=300844 RepID=A0AAE1Y1I1_9LAMI|nr:hypothetical protein Salat_2157500 [Sesamum alatum]
MGGGAWSFIVGGAIYLVNFINERDLNMLSSYAEVSLCGQIIAIIGLQRGIPNKRESSARLTTSLGASLEFITTLGNGYLRLRHVCLGVMQCVAPMLEREGRGHWHTLSDHSIGKSNKRQPEVGETVPYLALHSLPLFAACLLHIPLSSQAHFPSLQPAPASQTRPSQPSTAPVSGKGITVASQPVTTKAPATSQPSVGTVLAGQPNWTTGLNKEAVPNAAGLSKTSFAGLFSSNRKLSSENKLTKFMVEEGPLTLQSNDLVDVRAKLGHCLVGYIAGKFPGLKAIRTLAQSWGLFSTNMIDDDISVTPVWAIFLSLPLECWHPNALGKIGSRFGTPIAMDSLTMSMEHVSYTRILVEIDASKELVDQVEFVLPNGVTRK